MDIKINPGRYGRNFFDRLRTKHFFITGIKLTTNHPASTWLVRRGASTKDAN